MIKRLGFGVINQLVSGGGLFLFGIYMVNQLSFYEFGLYGIALSIHMLVTGVIGSLIVTQLVVQFPRLSSEQVDSCIKSTLTILLMVVAVGLFFALVAYQFNDGWVGKYLAAVTVVSVLNPLRNFYIRISYSLKREKSAIVINASWVLSLIILSLGYSYLHGYGESSDGLIVLGMAHFSSIVIGFVVYGCRSIALKWSVVKGVWVAFWENGRWALGGVAITWMQNQSYVFLMTYYMGPEGVGLANAGRMFITPFGFLIPAMTQVLLPYLSETREKSERNAIRKGAAFSVSLSAASVIYVCFALLIYDFLYSILIGKSGNFESVYTFSCLWFAVLVAQSFREGVSVTMQSLAEFKRITKALIYSASLTVMASIFIAYIVWPGFMVLCVAMGEVFLSLLMFAFLANKYRIIGYKS